MKRQWLWAVTGAQRSCAIVDDCFLLCLKFCVMALSLRRTLFFTWLLATFEPSRPGSDKAGQPHHFLVRPSPSPLKRDPPAHRRRAIEHNPIPFAPL